MYRILNEQEIKGLILYHILLANPDMAYEDALSAITLGYEKTVGYEADYGERWAGLNQLFKGGGKK